MFISILRIGFIVSLCLVNLFTVHLVANETELSDEEAFLIRRIADFWKDGEYQIVQRQINTFLQKYPQSKLKDFFLGILGDIHLQDSEYKDALAYYQDIKDPTIIEKTILNKLQCYYELDQFSLLAQEGLPLLSNTSNVIEERKEELYFLMGEALFRQAIQEQNSHTQHFMQRARKYYKKLHSSQYVEIVDFALAEIAKLLDEYEPAANAYTSLAEKYPAQREDLLFQAASLEAKYDTKKAIETFRMVKEIDGKHAKESAFNLIVLLFQNEEYKEILSVHEEYIAQISEKQRPVFHLIIGKSFFAEEDYQNTCKFLHDYINATSTPSNQLKNALFIQMTSAHQSHDEKAFTLAFEKFTSLFPNDEELPKALFIDAMILKEGGDSKCADEKLRAIKEQYSSFANQEHFLFEYGLSAHQNERWEESYNTFKSYINLYPESSRIGASWKIFLSSFLHLYNHVNGESNDYDKAIFFIDLKNVLNHAQYFTVDEIHNYTLLYAKVAYELEYYNDALLSIQGDDFIKALEETDPQALAEAHFIASLCYAALQTDNRALCHHLKLAMTLNPDLYDSSTTHIQLYNAYLSFVDEDLQQQEFIDHAAYHLQQAFLKGGVIKKENRLWLANYYYQRVEEYFNALPEKQRSINYDVFHAIECANTHYQALFYPNNHLILLKKEDLHIEHEILKLARLLDYQQAYGQKLSLLQELLIQQSKHREWNWVSQKQALYELANTYCILKQREKALETYIFVNAQTQYLPPSLANKTFLEAARLHFSLLEPNEINEEVVTILNNLKGLQIRKNASSEPIHLEAGLEYAKIGAQITPLEERDTRYLFLLDRMKEDFTSQNDPNTQDYLVHINKKKDRKQMFDAYMYFIDAEKMRIKAQHMRQQENFDEMEELHERARSLYNEVRNNPNAPPALLTRAINSIQEIAD